MVEEGVEVVCVDVSCFLLECLSLLLLTDEDAETLIALLTIELE